MATYQRLVSNRRDGREVGKAPPARLLPRAHSVARSRGPRRRLAGRRSFPSGTPRGKAWGGDDAWDDDASMLKPLCARYLHGAYLLAEELAVDVSSQAFIVLWSKNTSRQAFLYIHTSTSPVGFAQLLRCASVSPSANIQLIR